MAKKKVLKDHKQKGKVFTPPLMQNHFLKPLSWINDLVPELLWIALVHRKLGRKEANETILALHQEYVRISETEYLLPFISSYDTLSKVLKKKLKEEFQKTEHYEKLFFGLIELQYFYEGHPLEFLYDDKSISIEEVELQTIKSTLEEILVRRTKDSTLVQGAFYYVSFLVGKIQPLRKETILEINELSNYPDSELSREIASSIRATINAVAGIGKNPDCTWIRDFWNKSFQIEPPTINLQE